MASVVADSFKGLIVPDKTKIQKFDDRRFVVDLNKDHFRLLQNSNWDVLLIDLIDERHAMYCLAEKVLTYTKSSKEYIDQSLRKNGGELIRPLSNQMVKMTEEALAKIKKNIQTMSNGRPILIHRAMYTTHFLSEGKKTEFSSDILENVVKWNDFLDKCYDFLLDESDFIDIDVSDENTLSGGEHKWDLTPFHYDKNYYTELSILLSEHI